MQNNCSDNSHKANFLSDKLLSVVVPVYNEHEVLAEFHRCLSEALKPLSLNAEIIYVNDGSTDSSLSIMHDLQKNDNKVAVIDLSRNFGKEIAMTAGIDHTNGDAVIVIAADLQDPPELITEFIKYWSEGYDMVYAKRKSRDGESIIKKATAYIFYRLIGLVNRVKIPEDTGDFRLLSRRAVDSLKQLREQHRFMKGLFSWIGYPQKPILYHRNPRYAGKTKWNYWKLWNFALEGITSFTIAPLKFSTYFGMLTALSAFLYAVKVIYKTLMYGDPVAGYPSLMVVMLFLGGVQLIALGIIGEYLGRVFDETKKRPLYFLNEFSPAQSRFRKDHDFSAERNSITYKKNKSTNESGIK